MRIAAPDLNSQVLDPAQSELLIDLEIKESYLTDIVHLLSAATHEREMQTKVLTQLLVLILCPPAPFTNQRHIDVFGFVVKYLIDSGSSLSDGSVSEIN